MKRETMFDKDFYPTPDSVIEQMLIGHDVAGKIILEPSAGSGNIVDYLQKNYAKEVLACEINSKLRRIVESKCRVIAYDFLTVRPEDISHVDMIVMNPPFSDARRHILHAYEIAPGGCEIIALCNSSDMTVGWHATKDQEKLKELVRDYGYKEELGDCFTTAERKTDVWVSCLHLYKPKTGEQEFEDYMFSGQMDADISGKQEGLIEYNVIRDVVARYIEAVKRYEKVEALSNEVNKLTSLFRGDYGEGIVFGAYRVGERSQCAITRQYFKIDLQKQAWRYIINKLELGKFATSKVYEQINRFIERQSHVPFTMHNIYQMIYMIIGTQESRMETVIVEAFENICSFSSENSTAGEKWKTNSNYMVNKRFIVPYMTSYDTRWASQYLKLRYSSLYSKIADVITALEYITGKQSCYSIEDYIRKNKLEWGKWHDCGNFFRFRGYKKGTMHFEFVNDNDWLLFNRRVAEIKGWRVGRKHNKKNVA